MIYLDNAATTKLHPKAKAAMLQALDIYGNPSSIHTFGREAKEIIREAHDVVAQHLGATPEQIIFTASGSESDTMALRSAVQANAKKGKHIISSEIEHPAVLNTLHALEKEGYEVDYLPVDSSGHLQLAHVKKALRADTAVASFMYANNETGVLLPIQEIATLCQENGTLLHVDAVQAFSSETIDVQQVGVDYLSAAAHKIHGPKGVGILYAKQKRQVFPLVYGGEQEQHLRAGTENAVALAGVSAAVEELTSEKQAQVKAKQADLTAYLCQRLQEEEIPFAINGSAPKVEHIVNLYLPQMRSELLLLRLDMKGIAVSAGSACTAGNVQASHVLTSMYGPKADELTHSIRLSYSYETTKEEIEAFVQALVEILKG